LLIAFVAFLAPATAMAASSVTLESKAFVERTTTDPQGQTKVVLETPKLVVPGDRLVFELSYKNIGAQPANDFVVTNPVPQAVAYTGFEGLPAIVSVDGGKNWGPLASLKIAQADGTLRDAQPADVTHVRWTFAKAIPAGQEGKLSFRGIVK
jgi:uncharacterized repeat protein (TIGR01451 family)